MTTDYRNQLQHEVRNSVQHLRLCFNRMEELATTDTKCRQTVDDVMFMLIRIADRLENLLQRSKDGEEENP